MLTPSTRSTSTQKSEIIDLSNNRHITRAEKTKVLLSINDLDRAGADALIGKLKLAIAEREAG